MGRSTSSSRSFRATFGVRRCSSEDMRRTFVLLTLFLLPTAGAHAAAPPLKAAVTTCSVGAEPSERFAVFTGSMPAQRGTDRMAMRFDVQRRADGMRRFVRVRAPRLGRWERSEPGRAGFIWSKRVERLDSRASYRAIVRFRWYDVDGELQRAAQRITPVCVQPDPRADLEVAGVTAERLAGGRARYRVVVLNAGLTAVPSSSLGLTVGSVEAEPARVAPIAPGARVTVAVTAERCGADRPLRVRLDVLGEVDDADERDDRVVRLCTDAGQVVDPAS